MTLPAIHGYIDRRLLLNFTADPVAVRQLLPAPFRPRLYRGKAIVGICLIRLRNIKPKGLPDFMGVSSENGAHRIAVEWDEHGQTREGVYIPRRDTSLRLNALVGGRLFPGKHHLARFLVQEGAGRYRVAFTSADDTLVSVEASEAGSFNSNSIFETLENVSDFFKKGSVGYSPGSKQFDGIELRTYQWQLQPLEVQQVKSSFFEDLTLFPAGSVQFDSALLMTSIEHEWQSQSSLAFRHECGC